MILFVKNLLTADTLTLNDGDNNSQLLLYPAGTKDGNGNYIDRGSISDYWASQPGFQRLWTSGKVGVYTDSGYTSAISTIPSPAAAIGLSNATTSTPGLMQVGGDLGTSSTAPTVVGMTGTTQTTAPAAGAGAALPATPSGYVTVNVNGAAKKIAFY